MLIELNYESVRRTPVNAYKKRSADVNRDENHMVPALKELQVWERKQRMSIEGTKCLQKSLDSAVETGNLSWREESDWAQVGKVGKKWSGWESLFFREIFAEYEELSGEWMNVRLETEGWKDAGLLSDMGET